jgi:CBS domain containing-hemolysin-like protein
VNIGLLVITILLLLANGFFVGAEFALVAARRSRIEALAEGGSTAARLALKSLHELSVMLAGAQLGITMASLGLGIVSEPLVAHALEGPLTAAGLPDGAVHSVAVVLALTIVVFFHMVIGEMAPKNFAIAEPDRSALLFAIPFRIYATLFRPFIVFLNWLANLGVRVLGVEPVDELRTAHTSGEIGFMITESAKKGLLGRFEHRLLTGAVDFGEKDAAAVMVPRTEMVAIPRTTTAAELETIVLESGMSRIPIYEGDMDHIVGFFHAKDLLRIPSSGRDKAVPEKLIRQIMAVPESIHLHPLLFEMRRQRQHFALVLDEHGGTAGVVTLEDLLEELVGDIRDEYDVAETDVEPFGAGRFVVPGTMHLVDAEAKLGLELPEGEYETIAGFLMDRLGRIPRRRDVVEHEGWRLRVLSMHRRRVVQVLVEQPVEEQAPAR